jgi:hypothetical protein
MRKVNRKLLTIIHPDVTSVCETIVEFDKLFEGRDGTRGLFHQASPELRAPFTRSYATEDWNRLDDEERSPGQCLSFRPRIPADLAVGII